MNPFLHDTAGRPAHETCTSQPAPSASRPGNAAAVPVRPCGAGRLQAALKPRPAARPLPRHPGRPHTHRLAHLLTAAGMAALTWVGAAGAVDLNSATLDELQGIRGIGPKTAQIILDERSRGGRYLSFSDLSDRVRGIGPRRAQALQSAGLTIDGGGTRLSGQGAEARAAAATAGSGSSARPAATRKP